MKQHITSDQLNELNDAAKDRLRAWWKPSQGDWVYIPSGTSYYDTDSGSTALNKTSRASHEGGLGNIEIQRDGAAVGEFGDDNDHVFPWAEVLPLLSIGQMIEFLMATDYYRDGTRQHWLDISGLDHVIEAGCAVGIGWTGDELGDRLWELCREMLEHHEEDER